LNRLEGTITSIQSSGSISLVELDVMGDTFAALMIETPQENPLLRTGEAVQLLFKETEVSVAKSFSGGISCRNRLHCTVSAIDPSEILTKVTLDFKGKKVVSIITARSAVALGLAVGDTVTGIVKSNEISLKKAAG
jgi:molybdate transport system regulatory protein